MTMMGLFLSVLGCSFTTSSYTIIPSPPIPAAQKEKGTEVERGEKEGKEKKKE